MMMLKAGVILLIEDDPGDQKLIKRSLQNSRIINELHICSNAEQALEYLDKSRNSHADYPMPDLILLDLNMPGIGGKEFLKKVKDDNEMNMIPVVILTTSDSDQDVLESYKLQAAGYVKKPVLLEEFHRVIESLSDYWFLICKRLDHNRYNSNISSMCFKRNE